MKFAANAGLIPTSFRTLPPLRVARPASLDAALRAMATAERPAILAGGTDLPARFNEGFAPTDLIDLSRIASLREIVLDGTDLVVGAMVTHEAGSSHRLVRGRVPGFAAAWARIANVRIRLAATLGGNLMAGRPRYEAAILLTALGARLQFATQAGEQSIAVEDVWTDAVPGRAVLVAVRIPLSPGLRFDYDRTLRPILTQAVARDGNGGGRLVVATEYVRPRSAPLGTDAETSYRGFAAPFRDPVTSDAYIRRAGQALLRRQLTRLEVQ